MGTFAATAIINYPLSFTDQGKKLPFFVSCLQQTKGSCHFPLVQFHIYGKWNYIYIYRNAAISNRK
jgi:hypothetical protein